VTMGVILHSVCCKLHALFWEICLAAKTKFAASQARVEVVSSKIFITITITIEHTCMCR